MYGFVCKILLDSAGFFLLFKVNFNLQKTSAEISSVYFPYTFNFVRMAFRLFYSSSTINSTRWFVKTLSLTLTLTLTHNPNPNPSLTLTI